MPEGTLEAVLWDLDKEADLIIDTLETVSVIDLANLFLPPAAD